MTHVPATEVSPKTTILPVPGIYRHFKGDRYELLNVARHSESEELLALYCSVDHPEKLWVRPVEMFTEMVDSPSGTVCRFELQIPRKMSRMPGTGVDASSLRDLLRGLRLYARRGLSLTSSRPIERPERPRRRHPFGGRGPVRL